MITDYQVSIRTDLLEHQFGNRALLVPDKIREEGGVALRGERRGEVDVVPPLDVGDHHHALQLGEALHHGPAKQWKL